MREDMVIVTILVTRLRAYAADTSCCKWKADVGDLGEIQYL